jgi:hypothetical protein
MPWQANPNIEEAMKPIAPIHGKVQPETCPPQGLQARACKPDIDPKKYQSVPSVISIEEKAMEYIKEKNRRPSAWLL